MLKKIVLVSSLILTVGSVANAVEANKSAPVGGTLNYNLEAEPESLHPIMASDVPSQNVHEFVHDHLCNINLNTYQWEPAIAEKWEVSKNGLEYIFTLRKDAFFHNGENITAEDIKFSVDALKNPKHEALNVLPYIEGFVQIDVLDKYKIKFTAKEKYFKNLDILCGAYFNIIPKSVYGDINKSVKMQKEMIGSGPYMLEKYDKAQQIVLKRNPNWYGFKLPSYKGYYNFDRIVFKFTKELVVTSEKFKKGDLDYAYLQRADDYLAVTGKPFNAKYDGGKFLGKSVKNSKPKSYGYIGFNFREKMLQDVNLRTAFAYLVNRDEMNKKFYEGLNDLATGPVYVSSKQAAAVEPFRYNPAKAKELLTKAGWSDSDKNGVLDKVIDGKKTELKVSMIYARKDSEKMWTMVKEDYKKAGIELELKFLEWNTFVKTIEDNKMQLYAMGWGAGSVEMDPKQIWHSSSSGKGGSNRGAYANPEVDKLIDQGRAELDEAKRTVIFKKAYTQIAKDVPYIFLFNAKYDFYAVSKKTKTPGDTFKYDFGYQAWWAGQ